MYTLLHNKSAISYYYISENIKWVQDSNSSFFTTALGTGLTISRQVEEYMFVFSDRTDSFDSTLLNKSYFPINLAWGKMGHLRWGNLCHGITYPNL